jgi:hypothetical protein
LKEKNHVYGQQKDQGNRQDDDSHTCGVYDRKFEARETDFDDFAGLVFETGRLVLSGHSV